MAQGGEDGEEASRLFAVLSLQVLGALLCFPCCAVVVLIMVIIMLKASHSQRESIGV